MVPDPIEQVEDRVPLGKGKSFDTYCSGLIGSQGAHSLGLQLA